jgi:hypothetical protein
VVSGLATINTPTSFTLKTSGDFVGTIEFLSPVAEGIYYQAAFPENNNGTFFLDEYSWAMIDAGFTATYGFQSVYPNNYSAVSGVSGVLATGTYTAGDIFSLYADGTDVYYQINGVVVATDPLDTTVTYQAAAVSGTTNQNFIFTNVRYYPTGKCCSGGPPTMLLYTPAFPDQWESPPPTTMSEAMDRLAQRIFQFGGPIPSLPYAGFKLEVSGQLDVDYVRYNQNGRTIFTLLTSGLYVTATQNVDVEFILIGGGGGGGGAYAGGGGAGGMEMGVVGLYPGQQHSVTIGSGGNPGNEFSAETWRGDNGQNTTFLYATAFGGGGGSGYMAANPSGREGGCGGGGGYAYGQGGSVQKGYSGGSCFLNASSSSGGGGGLGSSGQNDVDNTFANGGYATTIYQTIEVGGGGGGGGFSFPGGFGGGGGGGNAGVSGSPNSGGGGGGSVGYNGGGQGGSGVVIISYLD